MARRLTLACAMIFVAISATAVVPTPAAAADPPATAASVTFTGKVTTGMMAIGGETTGTIISDGKTSYELDSKDAAVKARFQQFNGKQATVKGTLTLKAGIEVGQRRIITVDSIEAAASAPASAPASQPQLP